MDSSCLHIIEYKICAYSFIKPYILTHQFYWLIRSLCDITIIEMTIHLPTGAKLSWKALHTCKTLYCSSNQEHEIRRWLSMKTTFNQRVLREYGDQSHHLPLWERSSTNRGSGSSIVIHLSQWHNWDWSLNSQFNALFLCTTLQISWHQLGTLSLLLCKRKGMWKSKDSSVLLLQGLFNRRLTEDNFRSFL